MRIAFDTCSDELQVIHINDLASVESSAYLLKFDSVHGKLPIINHPLDWHILCCGPLKRFLPPAVAAAPAASSTRLPGDRTEPQPSSQ